MKAALPLANQLVIISDPSCNTGPLVDAMNPIFPPLQFTGAHTESKCPDGFPGNRPLSLNRACWEGPQGPGMVNRMGNTLIERIHFTGVMEVQIKQENYTYSWMLWKPNNPLLSDLLTLETLINFQCDHPQSVFRKYVEFLSERQLLNRVIFAFIGHKLS